MDLPPIALTENHVLRYCFNPNDQANITNEKTFAEKIDKVQNKLGRIEETQNSIAANFYSYSPNRKELKSTHQTWNKSIQSLHPKLVKCTLLIKNLYEELPSLPLCHIKKNMQKICHLALSVESASAKIGQLKLLLASSTYAESIILYKRAIENFQQNAYSNTNLSPKILSEITNQNSNLETLNKDLAIQIRRVHEELRRCFSQQSRNLAESTSLISEPLHEVLIQTHDKTASLQQIRNIEDQLLVEEISSHIETLSIKDTITPEFTQSFIKKNEESLSIKLRPDLSFCTGKLWGMERWGTQVGNPLITPFVSQLERIAQKLQGLEQEIKDILLQIYQGTTTSIPDKNYQNFFGPIFSISLNVNKQLLTKIRESLYPLLPTRQVHTALYYAARLFAHIEEIRFLLTHFTKYLSDDNNKNIIKALDNTYKCLAIFEDTKSEDEDKNAISQLFDDVQNIFMYKPPSVEKAQDVKKAQDIDKKIKNLFFAARSVGSVLDLQKAKKISLSSFNLAIATCLETIIARIGEQLFEKLSPRSEITWRQIMCSNATGTAREERPGLPMSIQEYIEKEITQWLFFSQAPSHFKLEMLLETLSKTPKHSHLLQRTRTEDPDFKEIYHSFSNTHPIETISIFCDMFHLLHQRDEAIDTPYILPYSKIIALLYRAKELKDVNKEFYQLISYVETTLQKKLPNPLDSVIGSEAEPLNLLFHLLSKALWLEESKQKEAIQLLKTHFQDLKDEVVPFSLHAGEPVNYLISLFALTQACSQNSLSNFETLVVKNTIEIFGENGGLLPIELIRLCLKLEQQHR